MVGAEAGERQSRSKQLHVGGGDEEAIVVVAEKSFSGGEVDHVDADEGVPADRGGLEQRVQAAIKIGGGEGEGGKEQQAGAHCF